MDDIKFVCPNCNQRLEAPEDMAGQVVECPGCQQALTVPEALQPDQTEKDPPASAPKPPSDKDLSKSTGNFLASKLFLTWVGIVAAVGLLFLIRVMIHNRGVEHTAKAPAEEPKVPAVNSVSNGKPSQSPHDRDNAAQQIISVPALTGRVADQAGILDNGEMSRIESAIHELERTTGGQIAILTMPTIGNDALESFSMRVAESWKIGHQGENNGALLIIVRDTHGIRLEIGRGWEDKVTNARAGDIIREIAPYFRKNQFGNGIVLAVQEMQKFVVGETPAIPQPQGNHPMRPQPPSVQVPQRPKGPRPAPVVNVPGITAAPPDLAPPAQGKPDGIRIAFVSKRDGNREIYVMTSDGSSQRNLSRHPSDETVPVWSPNGKWLLFQSNRDIWGEYFIMDGNGGNIRKVIDGSELDPSEPPCWAPNGKSILIDSGFSPDESIRRNEGLYLYDVETATRSKINDPPEIASLARYIHLAWSPDGAKIAFRTHNSRSENREGRTRIWTMNPDGTDAVPLTDELGIKDGPWWTGDSRSLVFTIHEGYAGNKWKGKICVLKVADKTIVETEPWATVTDMKPSPDMNSGRVAFTDGWHIYITSFDGRMWSTPCQIDHATSPTWSPDGTKLAFASTGTGRQPQIYIADADGGDIIRVTPTIRRETPTDADDIAPSSENSAPSWGGDRTHMPIRRLRLEPPQTMIPQVDASNGTDSSPGRIGAVLNSKERGQNPATTVIAALKEKPDDPALLAQLKALIPTMTNRADRCLSGVLYCLGCLTKGNTAEGLPARGQLIKAYPSTPMLNVLADDNITEPCSKCTAGKIAMVCTKCHGNGKCPNCHGNPASQMTDFYGRPLRCLTCGGTGNCRDCRGTGKIIQNCMACGGRGIVLSQSKCRKAYLYLLKDADTPVVETAPIEGVTNADDLREHLVREQVKNIWTNSPQFLSFIDAEWKYSDPPDEFMKHLRDAGLSLRKASEAGKTKDGCVIEKTTGKSGEIIFVGILKWMSETEAKVRCGRYGASFALEWFEATVMKIDGKWTIQAHSKDVIM